MRSEENPEEELHHAGRGDRGPDVPIEPEGLELRPRPRTTRLNRNALVLGAALGGAVLLAAAVTLVQDRKPIAAAGPASLATATQADQFWSQEPDGVPAPAASPATSAPAHEPGGPAAVPASVPIPPPAGGPGSEGERQDQRLLRAKDALPLVAGFDAGQRMVPASAMLPAGGAVSGAAPAASHPDLLGAIGQSLRPGDPTLLQNDQSGKRTFLRESGLAEKDETNPHRLRRPVSPYEVLAGAILPAVLVTQGNSDLPGLMIGRVRENVYDSATGRFLLIPQGTTLVGIYDSVVTFGQERLLVAWQRLLFPDGSSLNIGGMPGTDLIGAAGFRGEVDRHYERMFTGALLLSALTAGVTLSQQGNNGGTAGNQSTRDTVKDTLATALGQNLGQAGTDLLRREMNVQPTLEIAPGSRFNVFVAKDLVLPGPYHEPALAGGIVP